ncbi:hypothetical protein [Streptomyces sp. NPDC058758]
MPPHINTPLTRSMYFAAGLDGTPYALGRPRSCIESTRTDEEM